MGTPVEMYLAGVDRVGELADELTGRESSPVPGTPEWNVQQVFAHFAGASADGTVGRMDGAPGPEWTARHVAERSDRSLVELAAELRANSPHIAKVVASTERPAPSWDVATHIADLHEAFGLGRPADALWAPAMPTIAPWRLRKLPATFVVDGSERLGAGGPEITVSSYELFRAIFSRRSQAQLRAWAGDALTDDELASIPVFGPRTDDQPVPS